MCSVSMVILMFGDADIFDTWYKLVLLIADLLFIISRLIMMSVDSYSSNIAVIFMQFNLANWVVG